uniref:Secreted protein n=1 Tax=Brugia pahangi TaxID=6280 RepID=A0A0N4T7P3_BRUPA
MEYIHQPSHSAITLSFTACNANLSASKPMTTLALSSTLLCTVIVGRTVSVAVAMVVIKWSAEPFAVTSREERASAVGSRTNLPKKQSRRDTTLLNRHGWNAWNEHEEFL